LLSLIRLNTLASIEPATRAHERSAPRTGSAPEALARRLLFFGVAGRLCACDLDAVREIVPARAATRLPGAPDWVLGLVNLRGTLLTVVDLAARFGERSTALRSIIVAEGAGRMFGLGVDGVRDVQAVGDDALEVVDAQRSSDGIIRGLAHVGPAHDEIALVCDVNAIARQALVV
jgi:purine-binding chemotaxis protein CheW